MTVKDLSHSESVDINATPADVYELISDLPRMGEFSPENTGGRWLSGEPGTVGATFEGDNKMGERTWSTQCDVTAADPSKCFEFEVARNLGGPYIRWRFEIAPGASDGTSVLTEIWDVIKLPSTFENMPDDQIEARKQQIIEGIGTTLARVKATAEGNAGG